MHKIQFKFQKLLRFWASPHKQNRSSAPGPSRRTSVPQTSLKCPPLVQFLNTPLASTSIIRGARPGCPLPQSTPMIVSVTWNRLGSCRISDIIRPDKIAQLQMSLHSFIHSFILKTYIAPLQETTTQRRNYLS